MIDLDFGKPENKRLLYNLYAFARAQFFIMFKKEPNDKMKSSEDYVHEALMWHHKNPETFNPHRGSLENYLKFYVIRRLISNDFPASIRKQRKESFGTQAGEKLKDVHIIEYPDDQLSEQGWEGARIDELDDALIFKAMEDELANDDTAYLIYIAVFHDNFKFSERAEICEECQIEGAEFDKAKKRLLTIMKRVFKDLKLIN
jgi:hypothetical protein